MLQPKVLDQINNDEMGFHGLCDVLLSISTHTTLQSIGLMIMIIKIIDFHDHDDLDHLHHQLDDHLHHLDDHLPVEAKWTSPRSVSDSDKEFRAVMSWGGKEVKISTANKLNL